jgi:hypothetical protein
MIRMQYNNTLQNVSLTYGYHVDFTYGNILKSFSHAFLDQMLMLSVISLLFNLYVLYYTTGWKVVSYYDIFSGKANKKEIKAKILVSGSFICALTSLYYPIIIFGQLSGWYN